MRPDGPLILDFVTADLASHALALLAGSEAAVLESAAAQLGDLLRSGVLDAARAEEVVAGLVDLACADHGYEVTEEALHAICDAFHHELPLRVVTPLCGRIPHLPPDLVDYVLHILASTHDPAARPLIEVHLGDPEPVRSSAVEALKELPADVDKRNDNCPPAEN